MGKVDFSGIAAEYEHHSFLQKSAADMLLELLKIGDNDDVLDVGCGVGNLTRKIRGLTRGRVVGIDPSEGMIKEAKEKSKGLDITFLPKSAEGLDYENCFDVISCNSALQWFRDPQKAVEKCYVALRKDSRIGIQAPAARASYCPNFIEAIEKVKDDPRTKDIFAHFKDPWFLLDIADQYTEFFEKCGFRVVFSRIESIRAKHTPEEVFNTFSSGAAVGYLSQDFYDIQIDESYIDNFKEIVKDAFAHQANNRGYIDFVFRRLFLVAITG